MMEFRPVEIRLTLCSYGDKTSRASRLRVQLARGRYWPGIKTQDVQLHRTQILRAIEVAFAARKGQELPSEVGVYRMVTDLCAQGYALTLVEEIQRRLKTSIVAWVDDLAKSLSIVITRGGRILTTATAWQRFAKGQGFVRRTLRYLDQVYVQRSTLKGWTDTALKICVNQITAKDSSLLPGLARDIVTNVVAASTQVWESVLQTADLPLLTETFPTENFADVKTLSHMFLDLELYERYLQPLLVEELEKRWIVGARSIVAEAARPPPKTPLPPPQMMGAPPLSWTPTALLIKALVALIYCENTRIEEQFHATTRPLIIKAIIKAFFVEQARYFTEPNVNPKRRPYTSIVPIEVETTSGAFNLFLDHEYDLLRVVIHCADLSGLLDNVIAAWAAGCQSVTLNFLDAVFGDERVMQSEESKGEGFAILARLTESINEATELFDLNYKGNESNVFSMAEAAMMVLIKQRMLEANKPANKVSVLQKVQRATREAIAAALSQRHAFAQHLALCLVAYVDRTIRSPHQDEVEMKKRLSGMTFLLVANEWKHVVRSAHEDAMALRMFGEPQAQFEIERFLVGLIARECGESYVTTMDTILREWEASQQLDEEYQVHLDMRRPWRGREPKTGTEAEREANELKNVEVHVRVCPANIWPSAKQEAAAKQRGGGNLDSKPKRDEPSVSLPSIWLPASISKLLMMYGDMYRLKFTNRLLRFDMQCSYATVSFRRLTNIEGLPIRYTLEVSATQAVLLLHFNRSDEWYLAALARAVRLSPGELRAQLKPLVDERESAVLGFDERQHLYFVNKSFAGRESTIRVTLPRESEGTASFQQARIVERSGRMALLALEAGIVRFMKKRQVSGVEGILEHCMEAKYGLPFSRPMVQETLDRLVEKDYLSVTHRDGKGAEYMYIT